MSSISILRDTEPQAAGLVWENPPERKGQPGKYAGIAAALRERPHQWALVATYPSYKRAGGFAQAVRTRKLVDFRDGAYEVQVATVDNTARVYVRYLGVATSDAPVAVTR